MHGQWGHVVLQLWAAPVCAMTGRDGIKWWCGCAGDVGVQVCCGAVYVDIWRRAARAAASGGRCDAMRC
jgi:hypothetical protein